MSWRDLLHNDDETIILPWIGGRELRSINRTWTIVGKLPKEYGWCSFKLLKGRTATVDAAADPNGLAGATCRRFWYGYLVGDRFATEDLSLRGVINPTEARCLPCVHLIDDGLDRFARVSVGEIYQDGPLIFRSQEMPLGPEQDILHAYEDRAASVDNVKNVTPALDGAFRMASWQRTEAERRRAELERLRAEEEAKRVAEARREALIKQLGDGAGRREMAKVDFEAAARAALAVGGAALLDWKRTGRREEFTVKYRLDGRRFECVCDVNLHIVDAGICLQDHRTGIKGDDRFTLESLPAVVLEADRLGVLVVFRHV